MRNELAEAGMRVPIAGLPGARLLPFVGRLRLDGAAAEVLRLVAKERAVAVPELLHKLRGSPHIAETRQLAMYLTHVMLRRTYAEVGALFRRDRTTVSHACAHVEDLRDHAAFDAQVTRLETAIAARSDVAA